MRDEHHRRSVALRWIGPILITIGSVVAVTGSFGGWLRSGAVQRSSYEILGLIDRLGFAPGGPIRLAVQAWPTMPLLLTSAVVAAWWRWPMVAGSLGILGGLYAGALGGAVAFAAPERRQLSVTGAPTMTAVGAVIVVVGSLIALLVRVPSADAKSR